MPRSPRVFVHQLWSVKKKWRAPSIIVKGKILANVRSPINMPPYFTWSTVMQRGENKNVSLPSKLWTEAPLTRALSQTRKYVSTVDKLGVFFRPRELESVRACIHWQGQLERRVSRRSFIGRPGRGANGTGDSTGRKSLVWSWKLFKFFIDWTKTQERSPNACRESVD